MLEGSQGGAARAYASLAKPGIISLLVFTALASSFVASWPHLSPLPLLALALAGALSSGGCMAINDYVDRERDRRVPWLQKRRPLPAGLLKPDRALYFGLALLGMGLITAFALLPLPSALFVLAGAVIYLPLYTLYLKPRHWSNIVIGGAAGSMASLAGWALSSPLDLRALSLALLVFLWTPGHFWSLSLAFRGDYARAGIPMLTDLLTERGAALVVFANVALTVAASLALFFWWTTAVYLVPAALFGALVLLRARALLSENSRAARLRAFRYATLHLYVLWFLLILDKVANFI
ncbi:MAG: protoheme IX farnesyltransferase [Nitrososphaerota archaeon]